MEGWIKLHRSIIEDVIYKDATLIRLWIHILLKASHKKYTQTFSYGEKRTIYPGQAIFGRKAWAKELKLGEMTVYRYLQKLEALKMISIEPTNRYSIVKVKNWDKYQSEKNEPKSPREDCAQNERHKNRQQKDDTQNIDINKNDELAKTESEQKIEQQLNTNKNVKELKDNNIVCEQIDSETKEVFEILKSISGYKFELEKDMQMIDRLRSRYPDIDLKAGLEDYAIYKLDNPLKKNSSPRAQINTAFGKYQKWGKHLKSDITDINIKSPTQPERQLKENWF